MRRTKGESYKIRYVIDPDPDRLDEERLADLRRELASMSDAALARTYETYRIACGLRTDGIPRPATMQRFWEVWEDCRRWSERSGSDICPQRGTVWCRLSGFRAK